MRKSINIAIDGPSGAGKSTIAREIAARMGFIHVDTGAMYRAVGLYALRNGVVCTDSEAVTRLLPEINIELTYVDGEQRIFLNGEDVSLAVREHEVSAAASDVSAIKAVRAFLFDRQRQLAAENDAVMDGRDIGTVVLPDACLKIFLTASPEERARRRQHELEKKGVNMPFEQVLADVIERDHNDSTRKEAPLKMADDAVLVDTTGNTKAQSIDQILEIVKERLKNAL